ncbi:MAG: hypothetical protein DKM50_13120 [Candidatus Margulisiibacteriota bacterium]|nr:MAG: hypothetical protein A2X43_13805 [Candidatus Margulisbacteria bacterium GWD2_39_127]OGI05547.1 MAG: hypothetical protein A2X42_00645 [Candidatus Margulisbacteria bacterium GWF2_38_17]OGI08371.1 MAG: hypothetical protein A2X41_10695 [Candidatus Margulisbacteria bacterium GWE2_39_32]PZM77342.1 MAG: hypothetical protein DKM50_13120 [Candidatus Margulisiibacteriota bacterium]HAR63148.1 hypothetical protein [Candidatus Margulisiibacteriota bacterium]
MANLQEGYDENIDFDDTKDENTINTILNDQQESKVNVLKNVLIVFVIVATGIGVFWGSFILGKKVFTVSISQPTINEEKVKMDEFSDLETPDEKVLYEIEKMDTNNVLDQTQTIANTLSQELKSTSVSVAVSATTLLQASQSTPTKKVETKAVSQVIRPVAKPVQVAATAKPAITPSPVIAAKPVISTPIKVIAPRPVRKPMAITVHTTETKPEIKPANKPEIRVHIDHAKSAMKPEKNIAVKVKEEKTADLAVSTLLKLDKSIQINPKDGKKEDEIATLSEKSNKFKVIAGSYGKQENAKILESKLKQQGFEVYISNVTIKSVSMWRVQIGAFDRYDQAKKMIVKAKSMGNDAFYIRE